MGLTSSKDPLLECKHLSYSYYGTTRPAISDVNMCIDEGEFVVLTGPTGAGKSTLCLCMCGLIPKVVIKGDYKGEVHLMGKDVRELDTAETVKSIGIVFSDPEVAFVAGTVRHDISYAMENLLVPREEMEKRLAEVVKIMRLEGLEDRFPHQLSGGQKQRVAVGAGLAARPKLLILDEPTSELDPIGKTEVITSAKELNERFNMAILLVTHEIERVAKLADRMIVMNESKIVADGPPREVLLGTEEMQKIGVRVPQVSTLGVYMKRAGIIPEVPLDEQEACDLFLKHGIRPKNFPIPKKAPAVEAGSSSIIEVKDLWYEYPMPRTLALQGVSLKIYPGESVGIIGQNGSGKTTLVKHFNGLLKPTKGKVIVEGIDTSQKGVTVPKLSQIVGYVFQNPDHQIFNPTVNEEIAYGPRNFGYSEEEVERRVDMAMKALRISHLADEDPTYLGKGERGKIALASVMAVEPKVIVVDEPTTGQDWRSSMEIMMECQKLNKLGSTIITISHDMRLIAETMKRVLVMGQGKILLDGPTGWVFSQPEVLKETFLEPPQITVLGQMLKNRGFPDDVLTTEEMWDVVK